MTIEFTCKKCEASFEIDGQDLIDGTEKLVCPHCGAKAPSALSDDFISALSEIRAQVANLSKKFTLTMTVESEDLEDISSSDDDDDDDDEDEDDLDYDDEDEDDLDTEDELEDEDMDDR